MPATALKPHLVSETSPAALNAPQLNDDRKPNPIDLHVGGKVRLRRKMLGISQERLADDLGLTFQQVQKYERGANRVSASKLYEIAKSLQCGIGYFFEGLPDPASASSELLEDSGQEISIHDFLMTGEGIELAALFPRIKRGKVRRRILDLVRSMVDEAENDT